MLLPREIIKKEFSHAIGGYAKNEVKSYLEYVAASYETLRRENDELTRKLEAAYNCIDEFHKEAADREQGAATEKDVGERVVSLCRDVVGRLEGDLERLKSELSLLESTLAADSAAVTDETETVIETEMDTETETETEIAVEAETEIDPEIEAEIGIADIQEPEAVFEITEEIEFDIPEGESDDATSDDVVFDLEALLADDADETADETADDASSDASEDADEDEPILPDDIDSFMDGLFAETSDGGAEFTFEFPEDEPEQMHIDAPATSVKTEEQKEELEEPTAAPTEAAAPIETAKPKVKKKSYKISRAAKKSQPEREPVLEPKIESEPETKDEPELDEDAEALLQLLKARYAPDEGTADGGTDGADDDESFDTQSFDEFNYFFADTADKIETVPTKKNNDIDDI